MLQARGVGEYAQGAGCGVREGALVAPLNSEALAEVRADLAGGGSISSLAPRYDTSRQTVFRLSNAGSQLVKLN